MSIFNRIAGTEEPKIPVWPVMMDFTRVLDQEITFAQFATIHELNQTEQAEAGEYLTAIGTLVTERATALVTAGIGTQLATIIARGTVDNQLRYGLLRAEQGTITEAALRSVLGMEE
jgi:hypothetical protein